LIFEYEAVASHTNIPNIQTSNILNYKYIDYLKHSKKLFEDLYNLPINSTSFEELKLKLSEKKKKLNELLRLYKLTTKINQNINRLQHKLNTLNNFTNINTAKQNLFNRFMVNVGTGNHNNPPVYKSLDSELPTYANILKRSPNEPQIFSKDYPQNNKKPPLILQNLILQKPQNKQNESLSVQPLSNKEKNKQKKLERKKKRNAKLLFLNNS
jgi:hypothetical protein